MPHAAKVSFRNGFQAKQNAAEILTSIDTNLLFFALAEDRPENKDARQFLESMQSREDVVISEFVLAELYRLIRNPVVVTNPLSAADAVGVIQTWRRHPKWRIVGFAPDSRRLHDALWRVASTRGFAYRRLYDARLALALQQHGVRSFATVNMKDFEGFGFERVWNPLDQA